MAAIIIIIIIFIIKNICKAPKSKLVTKCRSLTDKQDGSVVLPAYK